MIGLPTPLTPYLGAIKIGAASIALLGAGYVGWHIRDHDYARYKVKVAFDAMEAAAQAAVVREKTEDVSREIRDHGEAQQASIRTVYQTIHDKVPVYVPAHYVPPADRPWSLPLGAVRLHDYAAIGQAPPVSLPSGQPLDTPSGVELPAFVGTVTDNYGVCREYREEVGRWREWYARESLAWNFKVSNGSK